MAPPMAVTFLGTGSAYPTPKKAASSLVLRYDAELWMFDCGEGTQTQLMKSNLRAGKITKIFITHLHGDHLFGLPGLLCTISQSNQRNEHLSVYGPLGLANYIRISLGLSRAELCFRFRVIELKPTRDMYKEDDELKCNIDINDNTQLHPCEDAGMTIEPEIRDGLPRWPLIKDSNLEIIAGKLDHRIPSFGFVINEMALHGSFDVAKLKSFGLSPGPVCKQLKNGEIIKSPTGLSVSLQDVTGPKQPGRKVVICGDSRDSSAIANIAQNADLYIHEATLECSMEETAVDRGHSTPAMAAMFALQANAKYLYITHFSQRYTESSNKQKHKSVDDLLDEAKKVFGENCAAADDLLTYVVNVKK